MKKQLASIFSLIISAFFCFFSFLLLGIIDAPFFSSLVLYFKRRGYNADFVSFFFISFVLLIYSIIFGFSKRDEMFKNNKSLVIFKASLLLSAFFTILGLLFKGEWIMFFILLGLFAILSSLTIFLINSEMIKIKSAEKKPKKERNKQKDKQKNTIKKETIIKEENKPNSLQEVIESDEDDYDEIVDLKTQDAGKPSNDNLQKEIKETKEVFTKEPDGSIVVDFDRVKEEEAKVSLDDDYSTLKLDQTLPRIVRVKDKEKEEEQDLYHGVAHLKGQTKANVVFKYAKPNIDMLKDHKSSKPQMNKEELSVMQQILIDTLKSYSIHAEGDGYILSSTVVLFKLRLASGVKVSKVVSLSDDIARELGLDSANELRVLPTVPGTHDIGIEVPNKNRQIVSFKKLAFSLSGGKGGQLPVVLGESVTGESVCIDLSRTPHLLIAGATGSGKSVCTNTLIASLLYTKSPNDVRLIMIDPKVVELQIYNDIPHLLTPVITEPKKAIMALDYCIEEMERRYKMLEPLHVRNIVGYNYKIVEGKMNREKMPYGV